MRILLTGASGFIGKSLIEMNLFLDCELVCTNRSTDWNSNLGTFDIVIHLAGKAHDKSAQWETFKNDNIELTQKIISNLKKNSPNALIVFFSTSKVYGEESGAKGFTEQDQLGSETDYGKSKAICETHILKSDLRYIILRPTLVMGNAPKGNLGVVRKFSAVGLPLPKNINNKRSLCSTNYIYKVLKNIFENKIPENEIYNLSEKTISTVEIFKLTGSSRFINYPKFVFNLIPKKIAVKLFGNFEIDASKINGYLS